jgi:hypothetical protein
MPKSTFAAFAALVLLLGCSRHEDDAIGETAYSGAFAITGASLVGACAILFPKPGSPAPRARCVAEGGLVAELTGAPAGDGTYQLGGNGGGLTWGGWLGISNAPGGSLEAGGEVTARDDVHWWQGRLEVLDEGAGSSGSRLDPG